MNRKIKSILGSMLVIAIAASMMTVGTHSYFSDTETSSANTFTAGTLDLQLSNDGSSYSDGVTATWQSPSNWAPGESFTASLHFTNVGSVDCSHIWWNFHNLQTTDPGSDGSNLAEAIIIEEIKEKFDGTWGSNQIPNIVGAIGDGQAPVTLKELIDYDGTWAFFSEDYVNNDGEILGNGDQQDFVFQMKLTFDSNAGNIYQGDSCTFDVDTKATQNHPPENGIRL